jgi:WD40 repeat protein
MGRVYLGESPGGRQVAVKVVLAEHARSTEFRERFAREIAAAKRVGGFHTAQVVDANPDADPPWMVTAYIEGRPLDVVVRENGPLDGPGLRALAAALAEGLAAIHACGLVHRDLKPTNILMAKDGPRIIDFGVARAANATELTGTGGVVGTPSFMSPEQIDARPVGPESDLFSLGSVLAYAATGRPPFSAPNFSALSHGILAKDPDLETIPGPLQGVIGACLAKDPALRPTAAGLLQIIGDITGPVPGTGPPDCPVGPLPRSVTPPPLAGRDPVTRSRPADRLRPQLQVSPARGSWSLVAADPAGRWIASADGDGTITVWDAASRLPIRSWPARTRVRALAASPGNWLATSGEDKAVRVWDVETGSACGHADGVGGARALALDWPRGLLATGGEDRGVQVWDVTDPREPVVLAEVPASTGATAIAFDVGGAVHFTHSTAALALSWDAAADQWTTVTSDSLPGLGPLRAAAVAAGTRLTAMIDKARGELHLMRGDPAGPQPLAGADAIVAGVAFAGSGLLVMGGTDGALHAWDERRQAMRTVSASADGRITALTATRDGARVAACHEARRVTVYQVANGSLMRLWTVDCGGGLVPAVAGMAFSPDGSVLVTAGSAARVWNAANGTAAGTLPESARGMRAIAFDRSGRRVAAAGADGVVVAWDDTRRLLELTGHKGPVLAIAFGSSPGQLMTAGEDETIRTWDLERGEQVRCLVGPGPGGLGFRARVLAVNPAGAMIAVGCADGSVRLCEPPDWAGAPVLDGHVHGITALCFDAAGRRLATASRDGTARIWAAGSLSAQAVLLPGPDEWAASAPGDGAWRGHGATRGRIWLAAGLARQPLDGT